MLEEESNGKSLVQILDNIITKYNKQKGVDSCLDARRLASDKGLVYLNGFLLIEVCKQDLFVGRVSMRVKSLMMFYSHDLHSDPLSQSKIINNLSLC